MAVPAEKKVKAASAGSLAAGLIDWLLVKYAFPHGVDATGQALILAAVPGVLAYAAGWLAPHTPRAPAPDPLYRTPTSRVEVPPSNVTTPPPGAGM